LWNNQVLVHLFVGGQKEAWATLQTKRTESLKLFLRGPKGKTALGRLAGLAFRRDLDGTREKHDIVQLEFHTVEHLYQGDLIAFLKEHLEGIRLSAN